MTTKGQRALVIAAVDNLLSDEDIADMSAAEKRKIIAALQHTIARLKKRKTQMISAKQIEAGAAALWEAFPTLREDFTLDFFRKVARIVLEAVG